MFQGEGENGPAFWPEYHRCCLYFSFPKSPVPQQARSERNGSFAFFGGLRNFYGAAIQKDLIPTRKDSSREIDKETLLDEQCPNHINGETRVSVHERLHTDSRISLQALKHLRLLRLLNMKRFDPEISEQLQILDVERMIFSRAPHAVGEAKSLCRLLTWRTLPSA